MTPPSQQQRPTTQQPQIPQQVPQTNGPAPDQFRLPLNSFPPAVQQALKKSWDKDGTGSVTLGELCAGANGQDSARGARHMLSHEARVAEIKTWMESDRFKRTFRNYSAEDVARLRGSVEWPRPASSLTSTKLFELVRNLREQGRCTTTFGCLDVAQLTQMSRFAETIYVSGWQASSHHSSIMEPGPDLADYPLDTVPKHVERLFRAQQFHDRKQFEEQWTKKNFENP